MKNCPYPSTIACACDECRRLRRDAAWQAAGVMVLIWAFGFTAGVLVLGNFFLEVIQ